MSTVQTRVDFYRPLHVTVTQTYVVWVRAEEDESQEDITRQYQEDSSGLLDGETPNDGWMDVRSPDLWEAYGERERLGPLQACPECGAIEDRPGSLKWARHDGSCPDHVHMADVTVVYDSEADRNRIGWMTRCSCRVPGFEAPFMSVVVGRKGDATVYPAKDDAAAALREHVAGRPHFKNMPLGITGSPE